MEYLSTGQAAKFCSVTPDTILKWIKAGKLPARRTAGGHYRILRQRLEFLMGEEEEEAPAEAGEVRFLIGEEEARAEAEEDPFLYCWEYHAQDGQVRDECTQCLVFRARARRCFEMSYLPREVGYRGAFCKTSCEDCAYFQEQSKEPEG